MAGTETNVNRVAGLEEDDQPHAGGESSLHEHSAGPVLRLADDSTYVLDRSNPKFPHWRRFLSESEEFGERVFVEADAETRVVKTVLAPVRRRVRLVGPRQGDARVRVVMLTAPSDFFLSSGLLGERKFEEFYSRLKAAQEGGAEVLVTSYPATQEIVDVRDAEGAGELEFASGEEALAEPAAETLFGELNLLTLADAIPFDVAADEFRDLASRVDYIPFDYPFDCCTARAHEMCRVLRRHGVRPEKVWNYGRNFEEGENTLVVYTNAAGRVTWYYHVAPVVRVRFGGGDTSLMVLDPALFDRPVTVERWRDRQNDGGATHEFSHDGLFYREPGESRVIFDHDHDKTRKVLRKHAQKRAEL